MSVTSAANTEAAAAFDQGPQLAWPAQISQQHVMKWVNRRLPGATGVRTALYHHPMLGVAFQWRRPLAQPMLAHALVDLVGGRAYAAEHWDDVEFVDIGEVAVSSQLRPPQPAVSPQQAKESARRLVNGVLLRRRRLDFAGRLEAYGEPVLFGKPNWWVSGMYDNRRVELIVDGLNGNHYVFTA